MQEVIEYIIALGYSITFERFGYGQILLSIAKGIVTKQQLIPDDHLSAEYLRRVANYLIEQF